MTGIIKFILCFIIVTMAVQAGEASSDPLQSTDDRSRVESIAVQFSETQSSTIMLNQNKQKFSLAVSGTGRLIPRYVELLKRHYPNVVIYDRNEEASRPPSNARIPAHPKVADVDTVFTLSGARETATIRNRTTHQLFNYVSDQASGDYRDVELILKRMVQAVQGFL